MWQQLKGSARFGQELQAWVAEGLISAEQATALAHRYELGQDPPWYKQSGNLLKATGLFIAALGFFLLIGANWNQLPTPARVLTGLVPLVVAYALAIKAAWEDNQTGAELAMIFGSLAFGANIALQAQIFHISAYFPDGLLWWIIGAMPVIWHFRSAFLHVVFQALFIGWLGLQNSYYQFSVWSPVLMAAFAYLLYRRPNGIALLFMLGSFYSFVVNGIVAAEGTRLAREFDWLLLPALWLAIGLLFLAAFGYVRHQYSERVNRWLPWLLQLGLAGLFYLHTFADPVREVIQAASGGVPISLWVLVAIAVGLYLNQAKTATMTLNFGVMLFLLCPTLVPLLVREATPPEGGYYRYWETSAEQFALLANGLFIGFAVWKIWYGTHTRRKDVFMTGVFWVVVWVLGRYMVLVGDYVTTGLIFIACGIGLYFVNRLWDNRLGLPPDGPKSPLK
jgi:uncharacterized membrane protein